MIALTVQDRCDLNRWLICGTVVLFAHAGIAAALIEWRAPLDEGRSGTDAIMLELEPMQVPLDIRTDLPPGPEQVQADPAHPNPIRANLNKVESKL